MRTAHTLSALAFVAVALAACTYDEDDLKAGVPSPRDGAADLPASGGEDLLVDDLLLPGSEDLANSETPADASDLGTQDAEPDAEETARAEVAEPQPPEVADARAEAQPDARAETQPDAPSDTRLDDGPDAGPPPEKSDAATTMNPDLAGDVVTSVDAGRDAGDARVDDAVSDLQVTESGGADGGGQPG